ncbi:MAG: enolase C-terminal domain-like protein [Reyranella sp.]
MQHRGDPRRARGSRRRAYFNQGLSLVDAPRRCHVLDDQDLYWLEEPIAYDNSAGYSQLTRELKTPIQLSENFYSHPGRDVQARAGHLVVLDRPRKGIA